MSIRKHHAEWLSLMEISGPFLTMPVLEEVLPHGLDVLDATLVPHLRESLEQWEEDKASRLHGLVRMVLHDVLGFSQDQVVEGQSIPHPCRLSLPEYGETLTPDYVLMDNNATPPAPLLLVSVTRPEQKPDSPVAGSRCTWTPGQRMAELCRASRCPLGLVTNGSAWMLAYAPSDVPGGGTVSYVAWYADLWLEERLTLRAFVTLLGARRFFACEPEHTLPRLMRESADKQHEVTDALGRQVRFAMTEFMQALDRLDRQAKAATGAALLADQSPTTVYEATLTVMMRLVFLLAAEERGLLRLGEPLYDEAYAVTPLCAQLRAEADKYGEEVLEYRHDAWTRLLALFRAVHGGVRHEDMRLPAYGGSLFDPDRYPFLEGRNADSRWRLEPARPIPVDNRVVLHMLESLLFLRDKGDTGQAEACRLSFRGLDVEQIGHVYEGLLDRTAKRSDGILLGLVHGKDAPEPHVCLSKLERLQTQARLTDGAELVDFLRQHTGKSPQALCNALAKATVGEDLRRKLLVLCGGDSDLLARVLPFAPLLREDASGMPVIVPEGGLYIAPGSQRRDTGTHYTPRPLTETLVKAALEPHVYEGPADDLPREQWRLCLPSVLLQLKVCDPAMGSGAFLVQCCRYLAEKLVESWVVYPDDEGAPADLPTDMDERLTLARRMVADRCLYGVDVNPLAVEMAKLSLWLITLQKDRPFTFIDHALKCGDSLLGVTSMSQLEEFSVDADEGNATALVFGSTDMREAVQQAMQRRAALECIPSDSPLSIQRKESLLAESETATRKLRWRAHALVLANLAAGGQISEDVRSVLVDKVLNLSRAESEEDGCPLQEWVTERRTELARSNPMLTWPFHWALEFPEVFDRNNGGFDVLVGNPPFLGSQRMREALGNKYREFLVERIGRGKRGRADLVAYFFLRAAELVRWGGDFGLIATNTLAQGDTREVGLLQLEQFCTIRAAWTDVPWSGDATVATSQVVLRKGKHQLLSLMSEPRNPGQGTFVISSTSVAHLQLNERAVPYISSFLTDGENAWEAKPLKANEEIAFIGSYVLGEGFLTTAEQAATWVAKEPRNAEVLFPYLIGEDVTSHREQAPSRWVINFWDWTEEKAQRYAGPFEQVWAKVRPVRQRQKPDGNYQLRSPLPTRWWMYARERPALYHALGRGHAFVKHPKGWDKHSLPLSRVLVTSRVSKHGFMTFVPNTSIFSEAACVFASSDAALFALLQSTVHRAWAYKMCSRMRTDLRYTPSSAFETFPRPAALQTELRELGERLHNERANVLKARNIGLTTLYNVIHNPKNQDADIVALRDLHAELDALSARAYGWDDLNMSHAFRTVAYLPDNDNLRHTIPEDTRLEILRRLALLNKERWEEEQHSAASSDSKVRKQRKKNGSPGQGSLLG